MSVNVTEKPLLLIAGVGSTGRLLIERLLPRWSVCAIDRDPGALERVGALTHEPTFSTVCGDATSTLVLRQAGLERAYAVLAVTGDDEVNLEVCRLAEGAGVRRRLALANDVGRVEEFERAGHTAVSRPLSLAGALQSRLEEGKRTTADVGTGRGEIYEVTVLPHSPVIGKTLSELRPQSWLVGAIYRKETLVVPHGSTQIQEGDRVLLVGDPAIV
ncbi:MAG: TrkA family potassium uptake protein, partial [Candidatus Eremiobacterota bacterium]